jgi:hypothetical protein
VDRPSGDRFPPAVGCIDRQWERVAPATERAVKLVALGNVRRVAFVTNDEPTFVTMQMHNDTPTLRRRAGRSIDSGS